MSVIDNNCKVCPEFGKGCEGKAQDCMCKKCPRNLGKCLITRYCTETESVLN
ncbi:hypothetical protein HBE96_15845 [Clostridium sp. P21]|uniref:Uncharacterized protein n=1 Tax=Clostridium muellerianum TaxID=2716538 RepID=A0A7Y0EII4_9CLOT|nr:hypothetical protein [Clostridium muellerianum]NMM64114.1 hypothetical protein [Clostridium muellerianum]